MIADGTLLGRAVALLALGRPLFLLGGAVFYGVGIAAARYAGATIDWPLALGGQVVVTASQLVTNYSNDYFDLDADRATPHPMRWSSGSRVLPEGRLAPWVGLAATLSWLVAALIGALFVVAASPAPWPTGALLALSLLLAWGYSSPPLWLNRRALGEISGMWLVPGFTALLGYLLQVGRSDWLVVLALMPTCLLQLAMLVAVNIPDVDGDLAVGKYTLTARLGRRRAGRLYLASQAAAYASLPLLGALGLPWLVALAPLGVAPIVLWLAWRMARGAWGDPAAWDSISFWSIGALVGCAALQLIAFVVAA